MGWHDGKCRCQELSETRLTTLIPMYWASNGAFFVNMLKLTVPPEVRTGWVIENIGVPILICFHLEGGGSVDDQMRKRTNHTAETRKRRAGKLRFARLLERASDLDGKQRHGLVSIGMATNEA
jgi:hypothetical protein